MDLRLSDLQRLSRFTKQNVCWYLFVLETESSQSYSAAGRMSFIEKFNDLIANRACDFPACSIPPQLSTLPRDRLLF
jgi:hypothetical protein